MFKKKCLICVHNQQPLNIRLTWSADSKRKRRAVSRPMTREIVAMWGDVFASCVRASVFFSHLPDLLMLALITWSESRQWLILSYVYIVSTDFAPLAPNLSHIVSHHYFDGYKKKKKSHQQIISCFELSMRKESVKNTPHTAGFLNQRTWLA